MEKVLKTRGAARSGRIPKLSMQELVSVVNQRYEKSLVSVRVLCLFICGKDKCSIALRYGWIHYSTSVLVQLFKASLKQRSHQLMMR